jgi:GNAT superfamily N-acetyltransferase
MDELTVRLATHADVEALVKMRREFTFEGVEPSEMISRSEFESDCRTFLLDAIASDRWQIWVAEVERQIVGHMFVALIDKVPRPVREDRKIAYLTNGYTRPAFRNKGIGAQLIKRAQRAASEANVELMIVWPGDESVDFYKRHGFTVPSEPLIWDAMTRAS